MTALVWTNPTTKLTAIDGVFVDLSSINNSGILEGFLIPQQAGAPAAISAVDGAVDWDATNNIPYWGNGAGWTQGVTTTGTQTLTNKTLTTPVIAALSNAGNAQTFFTSTDTFVGRATADTLTNKIVSVEGTGNDITIVDKVWFQAAGCNDTTATPFFDLQTAAKPAAACVTGTNTQKGVLDFDDTSDEAAQATLALPSDWTGAIDAKIKWLGAATTNAVGWCVQIVCTADGETDDPAFAPQAAGNCVSDTAAGTTLQTNDAVKTGITLDNGAGRVCAAGELMHIQVSRDANGGAVTDSFVGDARMLGLELTIRRLQ